MAVIFRSGVRQRHYDYLISKGFLHAEALEFSKTSKAGRAAPYYSRLIRKRKRTLDNAERYDWTRKEYEAYIKKEYTDGGFVKRDKQGRMRIAPWLLLAYIEDQAHRLGEMWESPWKVRVRKKSTKGKERIPTKTRRENIASWIKGLDKTIERTRQGYKRDKFIKQRDRLQEQLDRLEQPTPEHQIWRY